MAANTKVVLENTMDGYLAEGTMIKGGYAVVNDITNITEMFSPSIVEGSMVYNKADGKLYTYNGTSWDELKTGSGTNSDDRTGNYTISTETEDGYGKATLSVAGNKVELCATDNPENEEPLSTKVSILPGKFQVDGREVLTGNLELGGNLYPRIYSGSTIGNTKKSWNGLYLSEGSGLFFTEPKVTNGVTEYTRFKALDYSSGNTMHLNSKNHMYLKSLNGETSIVSGQGALIASCNLDEYTVDTMTNIPTDTTDIIRDCPSYSYLNLSDEELYLVSSHTREDDGARFGARLSLGARSNSVFVTTENLQITPNVGYDSFEPDYVDSATKSYATVKIGGAEIVVPGDYNPNDGENHLADVIFTIHPNNWKPENCVPFAIDSYGRSFFNNTETTFSHQTINLQGCQFFVGTGAQEPHKYKEERWTFTLDDGTEVTKLIFVADAD